MIDSDTDERPPPQAARVPGPVVDGRRLTGFSGRRLVRHGPILTAIAVMVADRPGDGEPARQGGDHRLSAAES